MSSFCKVVPKYLELLTGFIKVNNILYIDTRVYGIQKIEKDQNLTFWFIFCKFILYILCLIFYK